MRPYNIGRELLQRSEQIREKGVYVLMVVPKEFSVIVNQKTAKGQDTAEKIMREAYKLLADEGAANFSMLALAKRVGIARGNLQYYFPLLKDLVVALLWNFRRLAHEEMNKAVEAGSQDPKKKFTRFIDFVLRNMESPRDNAVMWGIAAMCANDPELSKILAGHYDFFSEYSADLINDIIPDLPRAEVESRAQLLVSLLEGSSLYLNKLNQGKTDKKALKEKIYETAMNLAA